jgi:two-component system cell cycle sensor histidine kinase/response regulator CckA
MDLHESSLRARTLLRSLLTFARRDAGRSSSCQPAEVLRQFEGLLRRMVPRELALTVTAACSGCRAGVDAHDLEQVLLNLVLNARDACPKGGEVMVSCEPSDGHDPGGVRAGSRAVFHHKARRLRYRTRAGIGVEHRA